MSYRNALTWLAQKPAYVQHFAEAGLCLANTRYAFNVPAGFVSASKAWTGAGGAKGPNTHTQTSADPPADVPVFWTGGSHGDGHVAISDGDGYVWTTDWNGQTKKWTRVRITDITKRWGLKYAGWSETLNGVRVHPHVQWSGKGWA